MSGSGHSRYFPDVRVRPFISKAGNKRTSREVARRPQTSLHVRLRQAGCLVWNGGLIGAFDEPESSLRPVTGLLRGLRRGLRLPLTEFGEGPLVSASTRFARPRLGKRFASTLRS
jgi:hypothetical protein